MTAEYFDIADSAGFSRRSIFERRHRGRHLGAFGRNHRVYEGGAQNIQDSHRLLPDCVRSAVLCGHRIRLLQGATGTTVIELPIGQHVAALAAGQIDGAYTLEPTGTIGRMNGTTRVLEAGVIGKYVLGDPMAPWFGGSASLSSDFIEWHPETAKKFVAAYAKGVNHVRTKPIEARQFLQGYTAIEGPLTGEVPLAAYTMYNEFTPADLAHFQKFLDLFSEKGIFRSRLMIDSMLYKG